MLAMFTTRGVHPFLAAMSQYPRMMILVIPESSLVEILKAP